jgi:hypothetical protein
VPTLNVDAGHFKAPFAALNQRHTLAVSRLRCLKFATTVGISHLAPAHARTTTTLALAAYRAVAVLCALDFSQATLQPVVQYRRFETTEKANIGFWVGMTLAAVAANDLLAVPRLIHASRVHGLIKANPLSKSLADLVGLDGTNRWHCVEAKARQVLPSAKTRGDWKTQATTVASVNGQAIATGSYCVTHLTAGLNTELVDPPRGGPSVDLRIGSDEFGEAYYRPFVEFLRAGSSRVDRDGRTFSLRVIAYDPVAGEYAYVGLDKRALDAARAGDAGPTLNFREFEDPALYVGSDGVAVMMSPGPCDL